MSALIWIILAVIVVLLDIAAFLAAILGLLTLFHFEGLRAYRWYLLGIGLVGALVLLPIADFFIRKAVESVTTI